LCGEVARIHLCRLTYLRRQLRLRSLGQDCGQPGLLLRCQAAPAMRLSDMLAKEARDAECAVQLDCPDRPGRSGEAVLRIFHGEWCLEHTPIGEGVPTTRHHDRSHEQVERQAHPNNTLRCHTEDRRQNTISHSEHAGVRRHGSAPLLTLFYLLQERAHRGQGTYLLYITFPRQAHV